MCEKNLYLQHGSRRHVAHVVQRVARESQRLRQARQVAQHPFQLGVWGWRTDVKPWCYDLLEELQSCLLTEKVV